MDTIGVSQTDFLSGEISMTFDLEKARDAAKFDDHMAITMFPLAIAEIERLRGEMENYGDDYVCQMKSKDARIQELEDALVDELVKQQFWCGVVPSIDERQMVARRMLQAEGKIGPDARPKCDHAWQAAIEERGYQTCLKCGECRNIEDIPRTAPAWQITEDRVTAIDQGLRFLEWSNAKTGNVETKKRIAILKTMLEEASGKKSRKQI